MRNEDRMKVVLNLFEDCCTTMEQKGKDYTTINADGEEDINGNFQTIADAVGITKYQAWYTFFFKHLSSIQNFIKNGKVESEPIRSRIKDMINYLAILNSMLEEEGIIENPGLNKNYGKEIHNMIHNYLNINGA